MIPYLFFFFICTISINLTSPYILQTSMQDSAVNFILLLYHNLQDFKIIF